MYLITDTFIAKEHFIPVPADKTLVALRCRENELANLEAQLREWARQLSEEMDKRKIAAFQ